MRRAVTCLRIDWSDLTIGSMLGEGGFGKVYKGSWQGNRVAIKVLNPDRADAAFLESLYQEALIMAELRHPCIARVYGVVDDEPHHALVMQYYRRGTLAQYMASGMYYNLDLVKRLKMALQVATGMRFMHGHGFLHQDLKTGNLLLEDDGLRVVIADFGLASAKQLSTSPSGALTLSVSPPEVLQQPLAPRTAAADVYAFGIVMLEFITGQPTYRGMRAKEIKQVVISGRRPAVPSHIPESIAAIMQQCWSHDPADRPAFTEVVEQLAAGVQELEGDSATETIVHTSTTTMSMD